MEIAIDSYGLPASLGTSVPQTLLVENPNQTQGYGFISSIENWLEKAADTVGEVADEAYKGVKSFGGDVYSGVKTVATDVGQGAEHILGFTTNQAVLLILAVGVGLYLAGKSGALKISF